MRRVRQKSLTLFGALLSWQILSLGAGELFELLFAHRLGYLFGSALERGLLYFSALGGKSGDGRHLLFFGFRWHTWLSRAWRTLRLSGLPKKRDAIEGGMRRRGPPEAICTSYECVKSGTRPHEIDWAWRRLFSRRVERKIQSFRQPMEAAGTI